MTNPLLLRIPVGAPRPPVAGLRVAGLRGAGFLAAALVVATSARAQDVAPEAPPEREAEPRGADAEAPERAPQPPEAVTPPPPPADPPPSCGARAHAVAADAVVRVRSGGQWGAGFVYGSPRYVVTAFSLLALGQPVTVVGRDGTTWEARLLARDESYDVAIIELTEPLPGVTPLAPAPETSAALGAEVVAIAHPFPGAAVALGERGEGLLRWSITRGHIGAVNPRGIQADMAVTSGHAGAPLLDCEGRVLGAFAGAGLLSADLGLAGRIGRVDELLAERPVAGDFWGDFRFRMGLGAALHIDEDGNTAAGIYLTVGATLFDRVSWMNRLGFFFGGGADPVGDELSVDRELIRIESLLGWRFFLDLFGLTSLYIVPAGGVSVIRESIDTRTAAVTPMCTPSDTESCVAFTETGADRLIARPAAGISFLFGNNVEIGYTLEIGFDTPDVETYHVVRLGFGM